jgi:hypothetical protein
MRLYRVDYIRFTDGPHVTVDSFMVVKETPCGYWIEVNEGSRWVSATGKKRYAYPTVEEAIEGWRARKQRQISILRSKIAEINQALSVDPSMYQHYKNWSSFYYPDRGERKEFKDAVLQNVDTSELPMRYFDPF